MRGQMPTPISKQSESSKSPIVVFTDSPFNAMSLATERTNELGGAKMLASSCFLEAVLGHTNHTRDARPISEHLESLKS
jgi:hypothetical protein